MFILLLVSRVLLSHAWCVQFISASIFLFKEDNDEEGGQHHLVTPGRGAVQVT